MKNIDKSEKTVQCLICQGLSRETKYSLTAAQIDILWRQSGKNIGSVIHSEMGSKIATLLQCENCGFRYFDPTLAGSGLFYEALKDPNYYVKDKPEFTAACRALSNLKKKNPRTLDVGCGDGAFLDLAARFGAVTYGTEINEVAAGEAARRGHNIFKCLLEDIPSDTGKFDFVSLFQVLEHLPNPLQVVKAALKIISPGGLLLLAVPNDFGLPGLAPFSPYQWPPHHITRWRKCDLIKIAEILDLTVLGIGRDPMITSQIRYYWDLRVGSLSSLNRTTNPIIGSIVSLTSYCLKILGANKLKLPLGHSIWIILQKPESRSPRKTVK